MTDTLDEALSRAFVNKNRSLITFYKNFFEVCVEYEENEITSNFREVYKFHQEPTEECYKFALETSYTQESISLIKKLKESDDTQISLEAITYNGCLLEFVKTQTPEICLEALKSDSDALNFVSIIEFKDLDDCINKLEAKLKLEKLISGLQ